MHLKSGFIGGLWWEGPIKRVATVYTTIQLYKKLTKKNKFNFHAFIDLNISSMDVDFFAFIEY